MQIVTVESGFFVLFARFYPALPNARRKKLREIFEKFLDEISETTDEKPFKIIFSDCRRDL